VPFVKGAQHTAESRAKMSRSGKRRAARDRERLKLTSKAVRRYLAFRECAPGLKAIIRAAEDEMVDMASDLTGGGTIEDLSTGKRLLLEAAMQTLVASRALFAMFVESRDPEIASRFATQATALDRALTKLGLERVSREIDLSTYLREKAAEKSTEAHETPLSDTNATEPDTSPAGGTSKASASNERSAPGILQAPGGRCAQPDGEKVAHRGPLPEGATADASDSNSDTMNSEEDFRC
jgi:hypothetical protein